MAYQMQCSKCGVVGELDTPVAEFECPSCGGTMLPVDAAPTATPAAKPAAPGGKKLIYTNIDMELTAISDFAEKGKNDPFFAKLAESVAKHNNLWCLEAEQFLLQSKGC